MKTSAAFALGLSISLFSLSAAAATEAVAPVAHPIHHRHRVHHRIPAAHHGAAQSAPTAARPPVPPAVQNDSDGLSLDPENCNMGCLGNTE